MNPRYVDSAIGVTGTLFSAGIQNVDTAVSIIAGLATAFYMILCARKELRRK